MRTRMSTESLGFKPNLEKSFMTEIYASVCIDKKLMGLFGKLDNFRNALLHSINLNWTLKNYLH